MQARRARIEALLTGALALAIIYGGWIAIAKIVYGG